MQCVTLPRITELNPHLLCVLCGGYYIDATSIIECLHAFCKSCIVRYLETHKYCPICDVLVHKTEPLQNIRPDIIRQSIVYKLVPNLYKKEMRNRRNFYVQVNPQQHPVCSESKGEITESSNFFSSDDLINLSLEYVNSINEKNIFFVARGSKRYFRCRAAVTIRSLRKLLAAKYALGVEHKINLFLDGIQLPDHFKLLDIAYISSWKRVGYIRILYEILSADHSVTSAEKIDLSSKIELTDESKNEYVEDTNAVSKVNVNTEKFEYLSSVLKAETVNVEISNSSHKSPSVTGDLTSPSSNATNVNTSSQSSDDVIVVNSSPEPYPPAVSSPKSIPVTADEVIPLAAKKADSVASVDKTDAQTVEKIESSQNNESSTDNKEKKDLTKEPCTDETSDENAVETNSSVPTDSGEKTNSLPAPPSTASHEDGAKKVVPVKSTVMKEAVTSKSCAKKERRIDRSESLPPVPALRMINPVPKTSNAKPTTTTVASGRVQPVVSIPRIPTSTRVSSKSSSSSYPVSSVTTPLSLIPPPIPKATDLISLYAKSPVARNSIASSKKSATPGLSILRIDPKTLSPIEASGSPTTAAAIVPASSSSCVSSSRKMLPCRPITSSTFANNSIYSFAGAPALHPFSKFSSPPSLYPPFPPSSLHPMNELVRRMFPFPFASIDGLKSPLDPSTCGLTPYPQSIPSAVSHFLTAKPASPPKQAKGEKSRRKPVVSPQVALSLNGSSGDKVGYKGSSLDTNRGYKRTNAAVTNGQFKSTVKRKNSELSDFSINNLIPVDDAKRPPPVMHACTADGLNQVCDQMQPVSTILGNESRKSS